MNRIMDVICFSGTGNTRLAVDKIVSKLKQNNIEIVTINEREPYIHKEGHELLIAFPANAQAVSPYIWKYFKSLPKGMNDKVHVVETLNESAAVIQPLKKLLLGKGYLPQGLTEISMPSNLITGPDTTYDRIPAAITQAEKFADDIINECGEWEQHKKGSAFVSFLSRDTVLPWFFMRRINKLETDPSKCKKCGLCVKECPVSNIKLEELPVHKNQCQFCMHCASVCKNDAIRFKGKPNYKVRKQI